MLYYFILQIAILGQKASGMSGIIRRGTENKAESLHKSISNIMSVSALPSQADVAELEKVRRQSQVLFTFQTVNIKICQGSSPRKEVSKYSTSLKNRKGHKEAKELI